MSFKQELTQLINKYNHESVSNTPDFILAEYLYNCLFLLDSTIIARIEWKHGPGAMLERDSNVPIPTTGL